VDVTKPSPEDYAIDPQEALKINAKATQGEWIYLQSPTSRNNIYYLENETPRHLAGICGEATGALADVSNARSIAYNHNAMPGILRRLMESEEAVLLWDKYSEGLLSLAACRQLEGLAERIKAGREAQA